MRRSRVSSKGVLAGRHAVLALIVSAGGVLGYLFPHTLWNTIARAPTEAASLAYKRLLVQHDPANLDARLSLASAEIDAADFDAADKTLAPVQSLAAKNPRLAALAFKLAHDRWQAARPGTPERAQRESDLLALVDSSSFRSLSPTDLLSHAHAALELGRPDVAARELLYLATGEVPTELADDCTEIHKVVGPRCAALLAVRAAAESDSRLDLPSFMTELANHFQNDGALLARADHALAGRLDATEAARWWRLRLKAAPDDVETIERLIAVDLGSDRTEEALGLAEHLVALQPHDRDRLSHAAELAAWADCPARSLHWWTQLAALGDESARQHALAVAGALHDERAQMDLLLAQLRRATLSGDGLRDLVRAVLAVQMPREALVTLRAVAEATHWVPTVAEPLAQLEEAAGDEDAADSTRALAERRGTDDALLDRAKRLWSEDKPEAALDALLAPHPTSLDEEPRYWRLVAMLAWHAGRDEATLEAYSELYRLHALRPDELDRYLALQEDAGHRDEVVSLCRELWERSGDSRLLMHALDDEVRAGKWDSVSAFIAEAEARHRVPAGSAQFWRIAGEVAVRRKAIPVALAAFDHVVAIEPSLDVEERMMWLALAQPQDDLLQMLVQRWQDEAPNEPRLWRSYALALRRLDRATDSLVYYQREAVHRPDDVMWLLAYGDALDAAGQHTAALQLRRVEYPLLNALVVSRQADLSTAMAQVAVASTLRGAAIAYPWARLIVEQARTTPVARSFAVSWLVSQGRPDEARALVASFSKAAEQSWPASDRFAAALVTNDRATLASLASAAESELSPSERVAALHQAGDDAAARAVALRALEQMLPLAQRQSLEAQVQTLPPPRVADVFAAAGFDSQQLLTIERARVGATYGESHWSVGLNSEWDSLLAEGSPNPVPELDVGAVGRWTRAAGDWTQVGAGLNWQPGTAPLWQASAVNQSHLAKSVDLGAELRVNDVDTGIAGLRLSAARDRLGAGVTIRPDADDALTLQVAGQRYVTRTNQLLSNGEAADVAYQRTLLHQLPYVRVRLTASSALNALNPQAPTLELGPPSEWIPSTYVSAGAGIAIGNGELDDERRRLRLMADAWGGWEWPLNRPVFRVSAGVGAQVLRHTGIVLDGYAASDQPGEAGQFNSGVELKLTEQLGR